MHGKAWQLAQLRFGQDASRLPCQMDRSAKEMCGALSYDI